MQIGKVLSAEIRKNRIDKEFLVLTVEVRKGQQVTAQYVSEAGTADGISENDYVIIVHKKQTFAGWLAFGLVDVINTIFAEPGAKIIYSRDKHGTVASKISLTEKEIVLENAGGTTVALSEKNLSVLEAAEVKINQGSGTVVEAARLQTILSAFTQILVSEFSRVASGCLPNPAQPYVPSPTLPLDLTPARSDSIKIP